MAAAILTRDDDRYGDIVAGEDGRDGFNRYPKSLEICPGVNGGDDRETGQDEAEEISRAVVLAGPGVAHGDEHSTEAQRPAVGPDPDFCGGGILHAGRRFTAPALPAGGSGP